MSPIRWLACVVCLAAVPAVGQIAPGEKTSEGARILEVLKLAPGLVAADVGAGEGKFTSVLARGVGAAGRVYATEVEEKKLDEIKDRMAADGLDNVVTVLGDQQRTKLLDVFS